MEGLGTRLVSFQHLSRICTFTLTQDMKGLAELTEEEQLEAAINASLQESRPATRDVSQENGDSDEFISLGSSDDDEMDGCGTSEMEQEVVKAKEKRSSPMHLTTRCNPDFHSNFIRTELRDTAQDQNYFSKSTAKDELSYRKRKSTDECVGMPSRKMSRSSNIQKPQDVAISVPVKGSKQTDDLSRKGKGKGSVVSGQGKGKGKKPVSVEEQLESGTLHKAEVSRILIRLPNGSRLHKAFLSNSPIKVCGKMYHDQPLTCPYHFCYLL